MQEVAKKIVIGILPLSECDKMTEDERRIHLPFGLSDVIYPTSCFTSESIFGAAHTGELNKAKKAEMQVSFRKVS